LDQPRLGGHRRARQLRRHLALRHGPTADHRRRGRHWCLHHVHPLLHHQQRYVQRRPGDDWQPRWARAGHPARWPGTGRRRLQHSDHHGEHGGTAYDPLPESYTYCNPDGHSNRYAYTDSYTNGYTNGYAHSDSDANGYANGHAHTDSDANCDSNGYAYTDSDADCDSNGYAYTDSYADCDSNSNGNSYSYAHADSDADCDSNGYAYADSYANCDSNSYAYADSYAYCDSDGYAYTDTYAYVDAYDPAETKPDTKATSDTAASPVSGSGKLIVHSAAGVERPRLRAFVRQASRHPGTKFAW
jgi:hypothetical protein